MGTPAIQGRWEAMTTFSPLRPRLARLLGIGFRLKERAARIGIPTDGSLPRLSMIGFARWTIVYEVPPREISLLDVRLPRPYLLFEPDFNGDSDHYLEAFCYSATRGVRFFFGGTYGIPRILDVGPFIAFVNEHKLKDIVVQRSAYPEHSTKMVRAALHVQRTFEHLKIDEPEMDDEEFARRYRRLLIEAQRKDPPSHPPLFQTIGRPLARTNTITVLAPVKRGRYLDLKSELQRLRPAWTPPPETHFCRWVLNEAPHRPPTRTDPNVIPPFLSFSAWFDGGEDDPLRDFAAKLFPHQGMWRHCEGWDGGDKDAFVDFLCRHAYRPGVPHAAYEGVSVGTIQEALALAQRVSEFAVGHQELTAAGRQGELREAWLAEFTGRAA
jgi:hypothetical protein